MSDAHDAEPSHGSAPVPAAFARRFDALVEAEIAKLPEHIRAVFDEVPLHVMDEPDRAILRDLGIEPHEEDEAVEELCGLHTGFMLTERPIELDAVLPTEIHLFRRGIALISGGWDADDETVAEQIRITLLHEIGHHFGLEEDDLDRLGYA
ncbi:MAG: metallopeptidase family protein [Phycisphaerales bacterium]|nr:metallopeptidase family protein [Phycisphaerales bacterium]